MQANCTSIDFTLKDSKLNNSTLEENFNKEDFLLHFSKYMKLAVEEKLNDYLKKLIILQ